MTLSNRPESFEAASPQENLIVLGAWVKTNKKRVKLINNRML